MFAWALLSVTSSVFPIVQWQVSQQEEEREFEHDYERTKNVVLERMKQAGEQNRPDEKKRMEDLCKHMEELKLKEAGDVYLEGTFSATCEITNSSNSLLDNWTEGGAESSDVQAKAAPEDREGNETKGRAREEATNTVRECHPNNITGGMIS